MLHQICLGETGKKQLQAPNVQLLFSLVGRKKLEHQKGGHAYINFFRNAYIMVTSTLSKTNQQEDLSTEIVMTEPQKATSYLSSLYRSS
jgi:hypothetical protein